jgi:Rrf2 family iron-sulfur cluster assembly transcriptional regulator
MRLTTKGRFAVTAMIDLALNNSTGPVTLADISERQKISLSYLEQLFGKLRRRALVTSVRGPGGGYNLANQPTRFPLRTSSSQWTSRSTLRSVVERKTARTTRNA